MGSRAFDGSARQIRLLRFLVDEVLAGRGGEISAPLIATRVLDRPAGFDSTEDTIVRVEISKLRRALARHYEATPGAALRIELPRGSRTPIFVADNDAPVSAPVSRPVHEGPPSDRVSVAPAGGDRPVLAVLPFAAVSAVSTTLAAVTPGHAAPVEPGAPGARSRSFARGLTDRLGILFADAPLTVVVSRAGSLEDAAGRGARYVLEGTVRLVAGTLRVDAKLHDTKRWIQIWGNTFDRFDAEDRLLALEDEIAREISLQLLLLPHGALHAIEAAERGGPARSVYELVLLFKRWFAAFDPGVQDEIANALSTVRAGDVDRGVLVAYSAFFHTLSTWTALGRDEDRRVGADLARRAVAAEPKLVASHQALAFVLLDAGDGRAALAEAEIALSLGGPVMLTGLVIATAGDWERGEAIVQKHVARLKRYPSAIHHVFCMGALRRGDLTGALAEAEAIATPNLAWDPLDRAVVLAHLGRIPEARAAGRSLVALLPRITAGPRAFAARLTADPALVDILVDGLARAGLR